MIRTGVYGNTNSYTDFMLGNILDVAELNVIGSYSPAAVCNSKYSLTEFAEESTFLQNVDAVIALSPVVNLEDVKTLVKQSKHVFFEPTSSYSSSEVTKLSSIVDEANVKVQAGFHHRFNNTFLSAKPFIVSPRFIQSVNHKVFNPQNDHYSQLLDMLVNDIDIVLSVVKSNVKNIYATASSIKASTPDIINVRLEFYNGCVAHFTTTKIAVEATHAMTFYCRESYTNIDLHNNTANLVKKKTPGEETTFFQKTVGDLYIEPIMVKPNNLYFDEFSSFAKSILYNKAPEVNIDTIQKTYDVVKRIKEKINLGF